MIENDEQKEFFVVWSPQGGPPVVKFSKFREARHIAFKLSAKRPKQDFFVLKSCWGKLGIISAEAKSDSPIIDPLIVAEDSTLPGQGPQEELNK